MKDYEIEANDRASQYALSVVNKEVLVSKAVYNSCKRHLEDMKSLKGHYWDSEESERIINFGEMMSNPSNGQPLELEPFQAYILGSLIGWKTDKGNKRFRTANISLARKQGKSMLQAILAIYTLLVEDNPSQNKQIHLGANSRKQSSILMDFVQMMTDSMISQSATLRKQIHSVQGRVQHKPSYSVIENLSNEAGNLDGRNTLLFVYDEPHEAPDTRLLDVISSGMVQQPNGQIVMISTAGFDMNKPYYQMFKYAINIASGKEENHSYFSFIAYNTEDEINNPELWVKSNPLVLNKDIGDTILENLKQDYQDALVMEDVLGFQVKNLNMWVQASENSFVPAKEWEACSVEPIDVFGKEVYVGLDLSRTADITAINFMVPIAEEKFYTFSHSFISNVTDVENKSQRDKIDYQLMIDNGYMTLSNSKSGFISYSQVIKKLFEIIRRNNLKVQSIQYDNWAMDKFILEFEDIAEGTEFEDIVFIDVPQNYKSLSLPIKEFRQKIYERNIKHDNNPLTNIAINNAILRHDNNNNVILDKAKAREKIDNLVAMVIAYYEARFHEYREDGLTEEDILSSDFGF